MFHGRRLEGAEKAETSPFAEYDPLRVHPIPEDPARAFGALTALMFYRIIFGVR